MKKRQNEKRTNGSKKELMEQINRYLDAVAAYIDNLTIVDYDTDGLPIYSRPKLDDRTVLGFEEMPFLNSVQESLDSYFFGHNEIFKYDYRHLYLEPDDKYVYRGYIKNIPSNGWEWPYTDFDDFNQLFVSGQEGYVYNKNAKMAFLNLIETINNENGCIPELYIIKENSHAYIMFSFCLKYPKEMYLFYMMKEPLYGSHENSGKKFI